ncbi:predicted protein [Plenodomus lingam JN3]|uniref:Predicted protein n=1 Tax=Leptosphaeria maculans (strain JN3 / isolate v23.1.3 / race Av1-4-5-6-7-8) TaxID=985895 RepID=E5A043_LEPMJ|nr:predicted protein [Plenodomus lingam JN3]CBX96903.1 predicted protein [Plenodomus lingam JN3]
MGPALLYCPLMVESSPRQQWANLAGGPLWASGMAIPARIPQCQEVRAIPPTSSLNTPAHWLHTFTPILAFSPQNSSPRAASSSLPPRPDVQASVADANQTPPPSTPPSPLLLLLHHLLLYSP